MLAEWRTRVQWLAQRGHVTVRPFRRREFQAEVKRCNEIYTAAYGKSWGFVPLTQTEFEYLAKDMNRIAEENMVLLAEADGQTVGFSITLPDMNEAIRPLNGRLTTFGLPIGLMRFLWRMPQGEIRPHARARGAGGLSPPRGCRALNPQDP